MCQTAGHKKQRRLFSVVDSPGLLHLWLQVLMGQLTPLLHIPNRVERVQCVYMCTSKINKNFIVFSLDVARTDKASLLQASIDQIISSEKLNGDTINLYFDFLGEIDHLEKVTGDLQIPTFILHCIDRSKHPTYACPNI